MAIVFQGKYDGLGATVYHREGHASESLGLCQDPAQAGRRELTQGLHSLQAYGLWRFE